MSGVDVSRLPGPDAVVALAGFPRRFRAVLTPVPDEPDVEELAERIGPDGRSALDHVVHATHTIVLLDRAAEQLLLHDDPVVDPAVGDPGLRDWATPPGTTVADALDRLADASDALATRVADLSSGAWDRTGRIAGTGEPGATTTVLDIVRDAVGTASADLRAARDAMTAARD